MEAKEVGDVWYGGERSQARRAVYAAAFGAAFAREFERQTGSARREFFARNRARVVAAAAVNALDEEFEDMKTTRGE